MNYKAPRGTYDILPEDQAYWRHVIERTRRVCELYGYEQIDVPVFEQTGLFERSVGESTDIVEKEMYTFLDRSDERMTLRPEFTAGICRAYAEHKLHGRPQPLRLFTIGPAFRYERPQAGRYRQFYQIDVEVLGSQDPAVDLEVMQVAWQIYEDVGIRGLSFQVNSTGCPACRPGYLDTLRSWYAQHLGEICGDCERRYGQNLLRLLDCKNESCRTISEDAPRIQDSLCEDCGGHFDRLRSYLDGLDRPYEVNHRLVRGLDYYTKTVFEVWAAGIGAQNAVCGGGRYDGLIGTVGGPETPAIGFASGIERIILTMKQEGIEPPGMPKPSVFVAYLGAEAKSAAVVLAQELRAAGVGTTALWEDRSLKAQMRQADRLGAAYTLIIGEEEVRNGVVMLRRMADSTQASIPRSEVLGAVKEGERT
ncbi:MAG: histidine--tRNA ligase [Gemmatimonadetes bacterium]|nr:histidine--tRNA ligase [Gemmatimonadota bacterium]